MTDLLRFLKKCEDITKKNEEKRDWSPEKQVSRILEEIAEVRDVDQNPMKYGGVLSDEWIDAMEEELADVILASITLAHKYGTGYFDLANALERKLKIVEERAK